MRTPPRNWILFPIARATTFVGDEARIGGLLKTSLAFIESARPYFDLLALVAQSTKKPETAEAARRLIEDAPTQQVWARQLRESGFDLLNSHSLTACWSALETCVEDLCIDVLLFGQNSASILASHSIARRSAGAIDEAEARALARKLESKTRTARDTAASLSALLEAISMPVQLTSDVSATLREANALRNCILHRGSILDEDAVAGAPSLRSRLGTRIIVTTDDFMKYHGAISEVLVALHEAAIHSPYFDRSLE